MSETATEIPALTAEQLKAMPFYDLIKYKKLLEHQEKIGLRQLYQSSFYEFFKASFKITNPNTDLVDNWHIKLFCDEIQNAAMRVIKKQKRLFHICINTPPKSLKSAIFSVAFPAWVWINAPWIKFITASYSPELADRDCSDCRRLIVSEWFQDLFGHKFKLVNDASTFLETDKGGQRRTTSPRSSKTGHKADIIVYDDPNAADDRYSQADRDLVNRWDSETMSSRFDNPDIGLKINIQQRIDNFDLTGHLQKEQATLWAFLSLPADLSEGDKPVPAALEKFYVDGLMFPARLSKKVLAEKKMELRTGYSGQINQRPIVQGGRYIKEAWFNWFVKAQLPALQQVIISVDASNTNAKTSCPASIQAWGAAPPHYYMLYDYTERLSAMQTNNAIERMARMYPGCILVIEQAANGYFLIEKLKMKYPVYTFLPQNFGGKEKRVEMIAPLWETGNVHVFDNVHNRTSYQEEIISFPNSPFRDRVDAMSMALIYFTRCAVGSAQFVGRMPGQV